MQYYFYCPQSSCKGYVFTGVCLSTGGMSASVHAGIPHPQEQTSPQSRHPLGADTPTGADTPRADTPQSRQPPTDTSPRADNPPQEMATAADGTHPTGMHSCLLFIYLGFQNYYLIDHYCKRQNVFSDLVEIRSISWTLVRVTDKEKYLLGIPKLSYYCEKKCNMIFRLVAHN